MKLHAAIILLLAVSATGYETFSPRSRCGSLRPGHGRQMRSSGYRMDLGGVTSYVPGQPVKVTVTGGSVQGLLLHVRRADGSSTAALGSFRSPPAGYKLMRCQVSGDSVCHSDSRNKYNPEFMWVPAADVGPVQFSAVVMPDYSNYDQNVKSAIIYPQSAQTTPKPTLVPSSNPSSPAVGATSTTALNMPSTTTKKPYISTIPGTLYPCRKYPTDEEEDSKHENDYSEESHENDYSEESNSEADSSERSEEKSPEYSSEYEYEEYEYENLPPCPEDTTKSSTASSTSIMKPTTTESTKSSSTSTMKPTTTEKVKSSSTSTTTSTKTSSVSSSTESISTSRTSESTTGVSMNIETTSSRSSGNAAADIDIAPVEGEKLAVGSTSNSGASTVNVLSKEECFAVVLLVVSMLFKVDF